MKNTFKLLGMIVLVAVIGIAFIACPTDGGGTGGGGGDVPPEKSPVAARWWSFVDSTSTATLDYSIDDDGVCTITVGGTAQPNNETDNWGKWKAMAGYNYTIKADTSYTYTFEAWTQSGIRELHVEYYEDNDQRDYWFFDQTVLITSTRTTYTRTGRSLPKNEVNALRFQCADQTGTFYVKILGIQEPSKLTITNFSGSLNQNNYIRVGVDEWNSDIYLIFGNGYEDIQIKGNTITITVWEEFYSEEEGSYTRIPFLGNKTIAAGDLEIEQYDDERGFL